jgi:hypothetical protein
MGVYCTTIVSASYIFYQCFVSAQYFIELIILCFFFVSDFCVEGGLVGDGGVERTVWRSVAQVRIHGGLD